ncbi:MAG: type I methionyl aminopeptidase [Candidatus Gottesmanbacteria bacterium]|nr:type I methionyl aminopeptidase [Candidatus Gottesmanbacteria bacterium]
MIHIKTPEEIATMREGGKKLGIILEDLLAFSTPGAVLTDIEKRANELIEKSGATASFKTVPGYKWATCLNVNEVVVHGIPTSYALRDGDVLTIDIGLLYKGFHTDTAGTKIIGSSKKNEEFLKVGQLALERGIEAARIGNRIGDISKIVQETIEGAGYSIVKSLVGHGIGRELHEEPQIPNYLRGAIENTLPFQEGMTIAIEPIYAAGQGDIVYENTDGWTLATRDRSLTSVFEHTLAVTANGPLILTKSEN